MVDLQRLQESFEEMYGRQARIFSAPGRVNLIGEHTDYNAGFVLPMAANLRTYVAAAASEDETIEVHSFDLNDHAQFAVADEPVTSNDNWVSYIHGVARVLTEQGARLSGVKLAIASDVPIGAGLSSSAALEVSVGYALLKTSGVEVDLMQLAVACQAAEHRFVGAMSGLMDQLTATFAEENQALFIDCRSLELTPIEMNLEDAAVVVCDTKVEHVLATSGYNERRKECELAVEILQKKKPSMTALRDVSFEDLAQYESLLSESVRRRCIHVLSENERTLRAKEALKNGNTSMLGKLMSLSHGSLRDNYEVSCRELDLMVDLALQQSGTFGARMMGGGFGGSTVNLIRKSAFESFTGRVAKGYKNATGLEATILMLEADSGVEEYGAVNTSQAVVE